MNKRYKYWEGPDKNVIIWRCYDYLLRNSYLKLQKSLFSKTSNRTWNNGLVQNWERSASRLYIVTLLI